jgi:hypothetical protein
MQSIWNSFDAVHAEEVMRDVWFMNCRFSCDRVSTLPSNSSVAFREGSSIAKASGTDVVIIASGPPVLILMTAGPNAVSGTSCPTLGLNRHHDGCFRSVERYKTPLNFPQYLTAMPTFIC